MSANGYKIAIKNPCTQDWNAMTPDATGRFCAECEKSVPDLTKMTDREIAAIIAQSKGRLCGRVKSNQLNRVLATNQRTNKWPSYKIVPGLLLAGLAGTTEGKITTKPSINSHFAEPSEAHKLTNEIALELPQDDSLKTVFQGSVVFADSRLPVPCAIITIGENDFEIKTDTGGAFYTMLPDSVISESIRIIVQYRGYEPTVLQIKSSDLPFRKEIMLQRFPPILVGSICVIKPKKWWQFWK